MNTNKVAKTVRHLQVGDLLSSGVIIVERPWRGTQTPSGKHEVVVADIKTGVRTKRTWNSNTTMSVTPAPSCFVLDNDSIV